MTEPDNVRVIPRDGPSLLDSPADLLVVPVNMQPGVMGAGLALAFARRWPDLPQIHRRAIQAGCLGLGSPSLHRAGASQTAPGRLICLFPTKDDWRQPSDLAWVEAGMVALSAWIARCASSVALPAIGCGLGGLDFADVLPTVDEAAYRTPSVTWEVWEPR